MTQLRSLDINAFRGATRPFRLDFDPGRRITVIYGDNGTGKTTIADALVCLCTDQYGSLDDKSGADKSFLLAEGHEPEELYIQMETDRGLFAAAMAGKKLRKDPSTPPFTLRHLRRSSVIELAAAAPAQRYEQLAAYFDLSGIVKSEEGLRNLVRSARNEQEQIARALAGVEQLLEATWKNEGSPGKGWEQWATAELAKDLGAEQAKLNTLRAAQQAWERATVALEKLNDTRTQGVSAAAARKTAEQHLAELQTASAQDPALLPLLETALHYLEAAPHAPTHCPLCQQAADRDRLLAELQIRLDGMHALREANAAAGAARAEHERLQTLWQGSLDTLNADLDRLLDAAAPLDKAPAFAEQLDALQAPGLGARRRAELFGELHPALSGFLQGKSLEAELTGKALDRHSLIHQNWQAVARYRAEAAENADLLAAAEAALKIAENTRKSYIVSELAAISGEVDALFQALHPGEQLGGVQLFLKEKGKNSLELTGSFYRQTDIAPQSLYSESHLDTLALCIFLALAKRYGGTDTVLLLDDVLGACDEAHLERFMAVLQEQSAHFAHIILTTHYRPWREQFAGRADMQWVELLPWTLQEGVRSSL